MYLFFKKILNWIRLSNYSEFLKSDGKYYDLNFVEYFPSVKIKKERSSAFLLINIINFIDVNNNIYRDLKLLKKYQGINSTLWGIKNENGNFFIEYYFYHPNKYYKNSLNYLKKILSHYTKEYLIQENSINENSYIISINPNENVINGINFYCVNLDDDSSSVVEMKNTGTMRNIVSPTANSFFYNFEQEGVRMKNLYYGYSIDSELDEIINKILSISQMLYQNISPNLSLEFLKFPYLPSNSGKNNVHSICCVAIKSNQYIGLYFDLDVINFIKFLKFHNYPNSYIMKIQKEIERLKHLKFSVGIDFYLHQNQFCIKKSAFFGTI
jgi:hypothetical protein